MNHSLLLPSSSATSSANPWVCSSTSGEGAYEVKSLVSAELADEILSLARQFLDADPHAGPDDQYTVNSLYFDTAEFAVFHRRSPQKQSKFRLRRYGDESSVYLERKAKRGGLVRKQRTAIADVELPLLEQHHLIALPTDGDLSHDWAGAWFQRQLVQRRLSPQCQVRYDRVARVGAMREGPIRLTIDRGFCCQRSPGLVFPRTSDSLTFLENQCIVEFKFRTVLPDLFKRWIRELKLNLSAVSKYRLGAAACGLQ